MKTALNSKTLWFNVIGGVLVVLQYLGTINLVDPQVLGALLVAGNFALRFVTSEPIKGVI